MPEEMWLGYAGTLGTSYDIPIVFAAMRRINNANLRFIVMGDGPLLEQFQEQSVDLNVTFTGRLDYAQMCGVLKTCDIVVNPIVDNSIASIINKHADYAASGKPVINTQKSEEYRELIEKYKMGFNCDSVDGIVTCISNFLTKEERLKFGVCTRKCTEELFDRASTYQSLVNVILRRQLKIKGHEKFLARASC